MRQTFVVGQQQQPITTTFGPKIMNFGDHQEQQYQQQRQQQQQQQIGDNALRSLREREMTLALMNQQINGCGVAPPSAPSSQGQQGNSAFGMSQSSSANNNTGLPTSVLDLYSSQGGAGGAGLQDNTSSFEFLTSSLLNQSAAGAPASGLGGMENQNQLLYSDALNRMMPTTSATPAGASAAGPSGGFVGSGMGHQPTSVSTANPYGNLNLPDHSSLGVLAGAGLGGMPRGLGSATGGGGGGTGSSSHTNTSINTTTNGLDPISAAFFRDNSLMRERLLARGAGGTDHLSLPSASGSSSAYGSLLGANAGPSGIGSRDWTTRSLQQQLLAGSQLPGGAATSGNHALLGGLMTGGGSSTLPQGGQQGLMDLSSSVGDSKFPATLPAVLAVPEDSQKLSSHQVLLRNQIEAFKATEDDLTTHTRGRNKPIKLGQVGIRCRHCARLPVARRQKGSTYFPASLHGLYQAAQNMNTTHMQSGLCTEMPPEYKQMFCEAVTNKVSSSVAGRPYWAKTAKQLGLIDTEDGIRFVRDLTPTQITQIKAAQQQRLQQQQQQQQARRAGIPARLLS